MLRDGDQVWDGPRLARLWLRASRSHLIARKKMAWIYLYRTQPESPHGTQSYSTVLYSRCS